MSPAAVARIHRFTPLPVAVGFGINTPDQAAEIAAVADAAVVGSAPGQPAGRDLNAEGAAKPGLVDAVLALVKDLAQGVAKGRVRESVS